MRTLVAEAMLTLSLVMGMFPIAPIAPIAPMTPVDAGGLGGAANVMGGMAEDASTGTSSDQVRDGVWYGQGLSDADVADEEERAADETRDGALRLIGDACGGAFEGGLSSIACDLPQGLPAYGEPLWQEACTWAGHELGGWWTDPVDGVMVADADGLVAVPSLEEALGSDDVGELTLFARWDTPFVMRRIGICHQRLDGTYGDPDAFVEVEAVAGEDVTWWCEETETFCAVTRTWAAPADEDLTVEVPRRTWSLTLVVDGVEAVVEEVPVGADVDLEALATRLGIDDDIVSWHSLSPQGGPRLGVRDTVSDLVGAGDACVLEARFAPEDVTVAFLPGCEPGEVRGEMPDLVVAADEGTLALPACGYARAGFSFVGWTCDAAADGVVHDVGEAVDVGAYGAERVGLVAVWEPCQVKVSVPVLAALGVDGDAGACVRRSMLTFENDSDAAVELAGVDVATTGPWRLVEWGSVVEDTDVALALETADGSRYDLSRGELMPDDSVCIEEGPATVQVAILCETGTIEAEGELCSLRWAFRVADAGVADGG